MSVTITIRKLHLAIAVLAVAVLAPATAALASHVFDDVPDGAFYAEAVEWAAANDITKGRTPDLFDPDTGVTRGENVTFAYRYDTNVAQPALAALERAQPFAATTAESTAVGLTDIPTAYVTVSVTAPVDGHVTVNSTALVNHLAVGGDVVCAIFESTAIPSPNISMSTASHQRWETGEGSVSSNGSLSGTRTFAIAAGNTVDYVLACDEGSDGGGISSRNLTAIFTPAP